MSRILNYYAYFLPHLGGIEQNIYYFSKYSKHEHIVLTNLLPNTKLHEKIDGIEVFRVPPETSPPTKSKKRLLSHILKEIPREINKFNYFKKIDFDLLHLRGPYLSNDLCYGLDCLLGVSFFKKFSPWASIKKPRVVTFHLLLSNTKFVTKEAESNFWYYDEKKSWKKYEKHLCHIADEIICVDHFMIKELQKFSNGKKIHYIPSGIDSNIFYPMEKNKAISNLPPSVREILSKKFTILFLGRLDPMKGLPFLSELADSLPDSIQLVQAGEGKQTTTSDKIVKIGKIENKLVPYLLNGSDVVFQPLVLEGISRVSLESMACGKPTIMLGKNLDRFPMENEKNGFVVDSVSEAIKIINRLHNSSSLYEQISKNAAMVTNDFSVQSLVPKLDQVYQSCL